jgi:hypothetical protein
MRTYKVIEARNKKHIGKLIEVKDNKTFFNKKQYNVWVKPQNKETPLVLISERPTSPVWVKLEEIENN